MKCVNMKTRFASGLLAGVAVAVLAAMPVSIERLVSSDDGVMSIANAQGKGQGGGQGQGSAGANRGGQGGQGGQGGKGGAGSGGGSTVPSATEEDSDKPSWAGQGGGGNPNAGTGDPESDRPAWAGKGVTKPGGGKPTTDRGDLYGDLFVVLRDANGVPILKEIVTEKGTIYVVQPLDADGNLIPLDAEGKPIDESLTVEVELSRLNVARSPAKVTDRALSEAVATLNAATDVTLDAAGRLVVLIDGTWKTIDSPIENLGLYLDLMADGSISGVTNPVITAAFPNLFDGTKTAADLKTAAVLLAAVADKFTSLSLDAVMYANNLIGVNDPSTGTYVDLTNVSYDRSDTYSNVTATVLVLQADGTYKAETVNIYDAVFKSVDVTATQAAGYAQAVDDARAVINYIHEYEVPATTTN